MKIKLLAIGKTDHKNLELMIDEYIKRTGFYISFDFQVLPDIKNTKSLTQKQQKVKEGVLLLKHLYTTDVVILLDEKGKGLSSVGFSEYIQKKMNSGIKQLVFIIGGPYGFDDQIYNRADGKISLSQMTFSHQMIRLFFIEQLYRAFTILKNEPYHHR